MRLKYKLFFLFLFLLFIFLFNFFKHPPTFSPESLTIPADLFVLPLNSSALRLTWNDNESTSMGFIIEKRSSLSDPFSMIAYVPNSNYALETFVDSSLPSNSSFEYRVMSIEGNNLSDPSNIFSAATGVRDNKLIFIPNFGTLDFLNLFTDFQSWQYVKSNIDGFGFFNHNLKINPECSFSNCRNVNYSNLVGVDAFSILKNSGIKVSIEVDALKWHSCVALDRTVPVTRQLILNIENAGGEVDSLFMDQPLNGGQETLCQSSTSVRIVNSCNECGTGETCRTCGYNMQQSAFQTAQYIKAIKKFRPEIKIGDTEPYSKFSYNQIRDWTLALKAENVTLDSFRSDVGSRQSSDIVNLRQIKDFFVQQNIPYGIIYWSYVPSTFIDNSARDREFFTRTFNWVNMVNNNNLDGSIQSFESWDTSPSNSPYPGQTVPINLPEVSSSIYSHTRLIIESLGLLIDNDARFVNQQVPLNIIAGHTYQVNLTFLNNGSQPWEEDRFYSLGSVNPIDNNIWGFGRVMMNDEEIIYPGQERKFSFFVTAPLNTGVYNFQWQMLHEPVERFGSLSDNLQINVMDPTLPNAPSNLLVTPLSNFQLRINWQDNSNNEMSFRIERRQLPNGNFAPLSTALNLPINTVNFTDDGLPAGASFEYRVFAVNTIGNSPSSNNAGGTTFPNIPNTPTNLIASTQSSSSIKLDWQDNSNDEYNFILSRRSISNGNPNPWFNISIPFNLRTYINNNLNPNVLYEFRILANNSGGQSSWSNSALNTTFICDSGQMRLCPNQNGVCVGAQETCAQGMWLGCTTSNYQSHSANYQVSENSCNDDLDNDCDVEFDYDGALAVKGDSSCPVRVSGINSPTPVTVSSPFTLTCTSTAPNVRSINGLVDSGSCNFVNWQGSDALFSCQSNIAGSTLARCNVNTAYSYQTGNNLNQSITVQTGICSAITQMGDCNNNLNCDWCEDCLGSSLQFSSGGVDRCVNTGTCPSAPLPNSVYMCRATGSVTCGAQCDGTINGCSSSQECNLNTCGCYERDPSINNIVLANHAWSSSSLVTINGQYFSVNPKSKLFVNGLEINSNRLTVTESNLTFTKNSEEFFGGQNSFVVTNPSGLNSVSTIVALTTNPFITSITPSLVLNDELNTISLFGSGFDPLAQVYTNVACSLYNLGLQLPYSNSGTLAFVLPPTFPFAGDVSIYIVGGDGTQSAVQNLRINHRFNYALILANPQVSVNSGDTISDIIQVGSEFYMTQEDVALTVTAPVGITATLNATSCTPIYVSALGYSTCEVGYSVETTGLPPGQYTVMFTADSVISNVTKPINLVVNINSPPSTGGGSSGSGSSSGSSGGLRPRIDPIEKYQCNDGLDNDNDGFSDFEEDMGCSTENDNSEFDPTELVESDIPVNEEDPLNLKGEEKNVEIRLVFLLTVSILIFAISIVVLMIIRSIIFRRINIKSF